MYIDSKQELIYSFTEHGLYYRPDFTMLSEVLTLTMGTIQLEIDCKTTKLLGVSGYMPLKLRKEIKIPPFSADEFFVKISDFDYCSGIAYSFFEFFPESKQYFMNDEYNPKLIFDENNKRILVGTVEEGDIYTRISDNIICGFGPNSTLRSILIMIDEIKK